MHFKNDNPKVLCTCLDIRGRTLLTLQHSPRFVLCIPPKSFFEGAIPSLFLVYFSFFAVHFIRTIKVHESGKMEEAAKEHSTRTIL